MLGTNFRIGEPVYFPLKGYKCGCGCDDCTGDCGSDNWACGCDDMCLGDYPSCSGDHDGDFGCSNECGCDDTCD